MRLCPKCHIQAGVADDICPICQNGLEGDAGSVYYWPPAKKLKKRSLFYKIQLLIVLVAVVVSLGLDFLIDLHGNLHWSVIVALWGVAAEYLIHRTIKRIFIIPQVISRIIINLVVLTLITAWFTGFWYIASVYIVPVIVMAALVSNFVMALIDKKENAMVYLLCSVLGGSIPFIGMLIVDKKTPILWSVCVMMSVVSVIGIAIFKGGKMLQEIRKRTNI